MSQTLENVHSRIKGSKLYASRLYIPYNLDYYQSKVRIKVYFEIINDKLQLFVEVLSDDYTSNWCKIESERIRDIIFKQFYEIIYDCETLRKNTPLNIRLKDNVRPCVENITDEINTEALYFLCSMKVSALIGESRLQRWFISIKLAQSRYLENKIKTLYVLLPQSCIWEFKKVLFESWNNSELPIHFTSIEGLSHNLNTYLDLLERFDSQSMLIIDGCHMFKSPEAVRTKRILELSKKCSYKLIMTDSLIVNNIHDIFVPYKILSDLILGYSRWEDFTKKHIIYGGFGGTQVLGYKNLAFLANVTEPYTYSIYKESRSKGNENDNGNKNSNENEYKKPKRTRVWINTYVCELTDKQKFYYKQKKNELLTLIYNNEIHLADIYRIMIQMQKISCGLIPGKNGENIERVNKLNIFNENRDEKQCVILCKFLFEIDMLARFLGPVNCAVFSSKNEENREQAKRLFEQGEKRYLITTIPLLDSALFDIEVESIHEIIFFSLSFKYNEYNRCINFIKENKLRDSISIKRFSTNSGIDRKILESLKRKSRLADDIKKIFTNKTELKSFALCL
ncbi:MAG: hypothetical protein LBR26_09330 [Prevotella sp.]|jgi:hypothetical protein|nr:hypothetical protein [Prevotella sp.]